MADINGERARLIVDNLNNFTKAIRTTARRHLIWFVAVLVIISVEIWLHASYLAMITVLFYIGTMISDGAVSLIAAFGMFTAIFVVDAAARVDYDVERDRREARMRQYFEKHR